MDCYDAYREPPQGCGTTIIGIIGIALIAAIFFFSGCKSVQPLTQSRDSVRVEVRHDSVYIFRHDSIFRDRWRAGDTVFITVEKYKTLYRDKLIEVHDTITDTRTEQVAVRYVPDYYKRVSAGFWILLAILLAILAFKAYKLYIKITH
ncbi:MAG: hypothetical protein SPE88_03000 [Paludibacteraceae bacterium]|nr:hypothetical protein [Paludibacteraceae bacterium]